MLVQVERCIPKLSRLVGKSRREEVPELSWKGDENILKLGYKGQTGCCMKKRREQEKEQNKNISTGWRIPPIKEVIARELQERK